MITRKNGTLRLATLCLLIAVPAFAFHQGLHRSSTFLHKSLSSKPQFSSTNDFASSNSNHILQSANAINVDHVNGDRHGSHESMKNFETKTFTNGTQTSQVSSDITQTSSIDTEGMEDLTASLSPNWKVPRSAVDGMQAKSLVEEQESLKFRATIYDLAQAAVVGILSGLSVALFKQSIDAIRMLLYSKSVFATTAILKPLIPALGGVGVGGLLLLGNLPPGLRGTTEVVDEESKGGVYLNFRERLAVQLGSIRKSAAAVFTLGSGCSLGPEGPCVEIGMNIARACMDVNPKIQRNKVKLLAKRMNWNRILLSCGAAAGVAAGFDAPIAGVFFAVEVMQNAFSVDADDEKSKAGVQKGKATLFSTTSSITPVLIASVISALCAKSVLGEHLLFKLTNYSIGNQILELPVFLLLGAISGHVAFGFSQAAKFSQSFFKGDVGGKGLRKVMSSTPNCMKPILGGLFCGVVALKFPQILFFGHDAMDPLFSGNVGMPTKYLLSLLLVKSVSTAVSAGSGLVGGTFAPALFLGAMTGALFHNGLYKILGSLLGVATMGTGGGPIASSAYMVADLPAYTMVGAASVLAALFRAPLTATLLLFELTKDYKVILPLMASSGLGSVVADILEDKFERKQERRRDRDTASWGDLSDRKEE